MWGANREELAKLFHASLTSWVLLIAVLCLAVWMLLRIRARFRDREDPAADQHQMLMQMGELHQQGGLSEEEYRSIKRRLIQPAEDSMRSHNSTDAKG